MLQSCKTIGSFRTGALTHVIFLLQVGAESAEGEGEEEGEEY